MKSIWVFVVGCILVAGCHTSKRSVLYSLEDQTEASTTSSTRLAGSGNGMYVFYKHTIAHDLKPDVTSNSPRWYFFESFHWKEVFGSNTSETPLSLELGPDEEIRSFTARYMTPGGESVRYTEKDLHRDGIGGDSSRYSLAFEPLHRRATLEVMYEVERKNLYENPPLTHDVALQLSKPAQGIEFEYTFPRHWDVQVKSMGTLRELEMIETENKRARTRTYSYAASDVAAFHKEPFGPYLKQVAPYFHLKVNHLEVGNVLEIESPEAWDAVARKYKDQVASTGRKMEGAFSEVLEGLGVASMSDRHKMVAIMAHVREDIEIATRGNEKDILKEGKGSIFGVTAYARALFEAAGIESELFMVHSAEGGFFDDDFISNEQLYMPMLRVQVQGKTEYLFPALADVPVGFIPADYHLEPALPVLASGDGELIKLPMSSASAYEDEGEYMVYVNADGEVRTEAKVYLGHQSAYRLRQIRRENPAAESHAIEELLAHERGHINGLSYRVEDASFGKPMVISASYNLERCFEDKGNDVRMNSCGLFEPLNTSWYPLSMARDMPVMLPSNMRITNTIQVVYPQSWTLTSSLANVSRAKGQVQFNRTYSTKPGQFTIEQNILLSKSMLNSGRSSQQAYALQLPLNASLNVIRLEKYQAGPVREVDVIAGGPWTVVAGSYDSYAKAARAAQELESQVSEDLYPIRVLEPGNTLKRYQVLVGLFDVRTSVETARIVLSDRIPQDSWISSVTPQMTATLMSSEPITY